jgi:hypothetical protein
MKKPPISNAPTQAQQRDHVTLLTTDPKKFACKRFTKRGTVVDKKDYDAGWKFGVLIPMSVSNIADLSVLLLAVETEQQFFIVRGAPIETTLVGNWVQRTGSGDGARFKGNFKTPHRGRHYILVDIDKFPLPQKLSLKHDTRAVCEYLIGQLPHEFHNVSYHYQLSSSAGMGNTRQVSMHLWFYLNRPIPDSQLKAWAKTVNKAKGIKLIDDALFQHVQVHYTARPIFTGMPDPFPVRSALVKKEIDEVNLDLSCVPTIPVHAVKPSSSNRSAQAPIHKQGSIGGFQTFLSMIGDHPEGDGFHHPLLRAASSYVGEHGREGTDKEALYELLHTATLTADASRRSPGELAQRASRDHIMPMIESALEKFGDEKSARRKSRKIDGVFPHYVVTDNCAAAATHELEEILNSVF